MTSAEPQCDPAAGSEGTDTSAYRPAVGSSDRGTTNRKSGFGQSGHPWGPARTGRHAGMSLVSEASISATV
jgi:hypothetical protein